MWSFGQIRFDLLTYSRDVQIKNTIVGKFVPNFFGFNA